MAERVIERSRRRPEPRFFADRRAGALGLGIFLNAGDPPRAALAEIVQMLDEVGVDCLELAVPFPDSPTDGEVIRRSASRALAGGADLDSTLDFIAEITPHLRHLRVAVLADWSHSVRHRGLDAFTTAVRDSGADAALLHGVPPRVRPDYHAAAARVGLPVITTCYHATSGADTIVAAAEQATAFVYLVSRYGRSGSTPDPAHPRPAHPGPAHPDLAGTDLAGTVAALRRAGPRPIAVGFGISTAADVRRIAAAGADAALVGSAAVALIEHSQHTGADVVAELSRFVTDLRRPRD